MSLRLRDAPAVMHPNRSLRPYYSLDGMRRGAVRFEACVPVPGTYVPETGTPPPFPNGMELEDAR